MTHSIRFLTATLLLSFLPSAVAQTTPVSPVAANVTSVTTVNPVTVIRAGDTIVIQGTDQMRYRTDPITRRLILEGVILAPGTTMPEGLT